MCVTSYIPVLELVRSAILDVMDAIFSSSSCSRSLPASFSDLDSWEGGKGGGGGHRS